MAVNNPPAYLQNAGDTHNADITRQASSLPLSGARATSALVNRGGVHPHLGSQMAVTQNGSPNMSVNVAAGVCSIPGSEGATQSSYVAVAPTTTNVVITAAHASLARIDLIVAKVEDSAYSGANNTWSIVAVAGTPSGSPVAPAAPNNSITLAQVAVAASVTTIVNANITDTRPYSSYGVILCRSTSDYPSPAIEGMVVYNQTDDGLAVCTVSGSPGTWTSAKGNGFLQQVRFTASGSFTKATYPGARKVHVRVQAAGGGGGGAALTAAGQTSAGGGGAGGGYGEAWLDVASLASSVTVTIGAAGAGNSGAAGGDGAASSFGAHVVADGGGGGQVTGAGTTIVLCNGGTPGTGTAGDILTGGSAGQMGLRLGTAAGNCMAGTGGGSLLGGGGWARQNVDGISGRLYGGGGGGACNNPSQAARSGGAGGAGIVIVDVYV